MALKYAGIDFQLREISLKDKPASMLQASPKGTVPVLLLGTQVLEQSLDIIHWALSQSDPSGWLLVDQTLARAWVEKNDGPFKKLLDQYKYPNRHPQLNTQNVLDSAVELMLSPMEQALSTQPYLMGEHLSWVDIAIFPFIRQFSMVNPDQFKSLSLPKLQHWLSERINSKLFQSVMEKYPTYTD